MTTPTASQPRGVPVGGRFAPTTHAETSVALGGPAAQPDFVVGRLRSLGFLDQLNDDHIHAVTAKLNESLDFSDRNIEEAPSWCTSWTTATPPQPPEKRRPGWTSCSNWGRRTRPTPWSSSGQPRWPRPPTHPATLRRRRCRTGRRSPCRQRTPGCSEETSSNGWKSAAGVRPRLHQRLPAGHPGDPVPGQPSLHRRGGLHALRRRRLRQQLSNRR